MSRSYNIGFKDGTLSGYKLAFNDMVPIIRYLNNICTEEEIQDLKKQLDCTASIYLAEKIEGLNNASK